MLRNTYKCNFIKLSQVQDEMDNQSKACQVMRIVGFTVYWKENHS